MPEPTSWDVDETSKHVGEILRIFSGHTSHVFCCAINHPAGAYPRPLQLNLSRFCH
jgi:hypothetical protein